MTSTVIDLPVEDLVERCDRCSAQAKVRADLANGSLYFCGHHARQMQDSLINVSLTIYDPEKVFNNGNF